MQRDGRWHSFPNERIEGAGAPPLDWHADHLDGDWLWKLATAPYPGSHYATYPLTLPRRLIAAMCPARVCRECGWPSEREVGATEYSDRKTGRAPATLDMRDGQRIAEGVNNWSANGATRGDTSVIAHRETTGWTDCGHDAWRPGRVLDPFGGSGTTAVAAALQGVDATLIDLDSRNVDLVDKRLRENVRVTGFFHIADDNSYVWTVEAVSAPELEQHNAGQMGLFA
jgi:hypothetical protein